MHKLPAITGKDLIKFLESIGFKVIRIKGSHVRLKNEEGKATTVPLHGSETLPKGLLRKIIREDLEMSLEEFLILFNNFKS
ncbi:MULTISPECIES: type II toxin-antitoxin system HicA family toxin [Thermodesulfovibrio]|uniref:type II toxin-antitoxin system HicA family toxin n=1 Tax=Thermodesulfovibrio TaxID=28261 RepID=UPI0004217A28|nr:MULTISPECIES: type II toxin-antitoxin system HicA family toxin [Thermodesulfovibrio]